MDTLLDLNEFNAVDVKHDTALVSLPLTNKVFRQVYSRNNDKKLAAKELAYIAYIASHKSPGNIKGLSNKELVRDAIKNIGLPVTWQEDDLILQGIAEFKKLYTYGIYGTINSFRKSLDDIRRSANLLGGALSEEVREIEQESKVNEKLRGDHLKTRVRSILDSFNHIKTIVGSIEQDIHNLKELERKLSAEEIKRKTARGNTIIPRSADPS